jgi:hypothetical protein
MLAADHIPQPIFHLEAVVRLRDAAGDQPFGMGAAPFVESGHGGGVGRFVDGAVGLNQNKPAGRL